MVHLTGRTRARVDWRGRIVLQVEISEPVRSRLLTPPRLGEVDRRPRRLCWRDARQADFASLVPPQVIVGPEAEDKARG